MPKSDVRDGIVRRERRLVRLSPTQLVVTLCGLLTVLLVGAIVVGPGWHDMYALEYGLPRMEGPWGFQLGTIRVQHDGQIYERTGVVALAPGGRLERAGVRLHDVPFGYHGHGYAMFYEALRAGNRGEAASFEVVNTDDLIKGRWDHRTVQIPSR